MCASLGGEILPPTKGEVSPFDDEVLPVLQGRVKDLPQNGPEVGLQCSVLFRGEGGLPAADESHFQQVDGEVRDVVPLQKPLGQPSFSRVGKLL